MRKLVVIEFLSLDGVMQAPGAPEEDTEGGFRHGGWSMPYADEVMGQAAAEGMAATDTHLFGRKTYEIMAAHWPHAPGEDPFAQHLNNVEKYVVSTTLRKADWQNTTIIDGNVAERVARLKEQPGKNIGVLGSGELVHTLIENDLVDEYSLTVYPIVLGSGKKLFRDADQTRKLKLVDSKPTTTGGLMLTYQPER
ncbi:MAG: dihydrofolate reductase family protein [Actinomycetota bacterium]